ncbi:PIG-L deacetylase family protein [Metabacillus niabensis]|uniref:PIG-L deacetylase family protein n=1 Tax=Metabacillus niabensis TaxID=324854 RepID=UPI001CFA43DF|nr:PIG-L deacetylase family protein [Metabacillus niabensis]
MNSLLIKKAEQLIQDFKRPRIFKIQEGKRVLVIAPHADDEVIGAGGSIVKHRRKNNPVHIVFITDGSNGRSRSESSEETINVRKKEVIRACKVLDVEFSMLEAQDSQFVPDSCLINKLRKVILDVKPDYIYIPHYRDKHRDHFYTNLLFYSACTDDGFFQNAGLLDVNVLAYEVWSPLEPNVFVNITNEYDIKQQAMEEYPSQLSLIPYIKMMSGINQYRVSLFPLPKTEYVEAFYQCPCLKYCQEIEAYIDNSVFKEEQC